jgi:hypothetical protein
MRHSKSFRKKTSRAELANAKREAAKQAIRSHFGQEPCPESDPVTELVTILLEDGAGGIEPPSAVSVTKDQWLTWSRLLLEHPEALTRATAQELTREVVPIPAEREAMRTWAGELLLRVLDRLGMA